MKIIQKGAITYLIICVHCDYFIDLCAQFHCGVLMFAYCAWRQSYVIALPGQLPQLLHCFELPWDLLHVSEMHKGLTCLLSAFIQPGTLLAWMMNLGPWTWCQDETLAHGHIASQGTRFVRGCICWPLVRVPGFVHVLARGCDFVASLNQIKSPTCTWCSCGDVLWYNGCVWMNECCGDWRASEVGIFPSHFSAYCYCGPYLKSVLYLEK